MNVELIALLDVADASANTVDATAAVVANALWWMAELEALHYT